MLFCLREEVLRHSCNETHIFALEWSVAVFSVARTDFVVILDARGEGTSASGPMNLLQLFLFASFLGLWCR